MLSDYLDRSNFTDARIRASLESAEQEVERELTWYVKLDDLTFLNTADKKIEQTQIHLGSISDQTKARMRVVEGVYTLTLKTKLESKERGSNDLETTQVIDPKFYNAWLKSGVPYQMYEKTRYVIRIADTNLVWEVDLFKNNDGGYSPWAKIDLELPDGLVLKKLPKFPATPLEVHTPDGDNPRLDKFIEKLWSDEWSLITDPNDYPKPKVM